MTQKILQEAPIITPNVLVKWVHYHFLALNFILYVASSASIRSTPPIALLYNFIIWEQGIDIFFYLALEKHSTRI